MSTHEKLMAEIEIVAETAMRIKRQRDALWEVLADCLEYFDERADADHDGERFIANKELTLYGAIQRELEKGKA